MPVVDVYNLKNEKVSELTLDDQVFGVEVKPHLFWEVVRAQLAARRGGNASTKERSDVQGAYRKLFRQKGTGRARKGSVRSPLHRGGGTVFGPHPRSFAYKVPKKVRKGALRSALTKRLLDQKLMVLEAFELDEIKTKALVEILARLGIENALIVDEANEKLQKSARNLQKVQFLPTAGLNVHDILRYENLILTVPSVKVIEGALRP